LIIIDNEKETSTLCGAVIKSLHTRVLRCKNHPSPPKHDCCLRVLRSRLIEKHAMGNQES
jgi:hypothetical protein